MAQTSKAKIYNSLINEIFRHHYYTSGITQFEFNCSELEEVGILLGLDPKI